MNTKYIFAINKDSPVGVKVIKSHKILKIKNFYKRPELVRKYLLETPSNHFQNMMSNPETGLIGMRSIVDLELSELWFTVLHLATTEFGIDPTDALFREQFVSNIYTHLNKGESYGKNVAPHFDPSITASVWLNLPDECKGGTAFYYNSRYKAHDLEDVVDFNNYKKIKKAYPDGVDDDWEMVDLVPMEYNTFIMYNAMRFHNPYIEPEWYQDCYRISQMMFLNFPTNKLNRNFKRYDS